jgi:flotillin
MIGFLLAAALIGGPIGLSFAHIQIGFVSSAIMVGSGIVIMLILGITSIIAKLYQRTKANEAFVRTGMGGVQVIQDGGALVIPAIHECVRISLQTLKLEVSREHKDALITRDNLRADIKAEFFVRVKPERDSILQASRSLGDKMSDVSQISDTVENKLVSALRSAAAKKTLTELHTDREAFVHEVMKDITNDLAENGLTLETVTISRLDQTNVDAMSDNNIFDAQGKRTIAEITQRQMTERNEFERKGEQLRKQQDVDTAKQILSLEQDQKNAQANQVAQIAQVSAQQDRIAKEKAIEAQRAVELAEIEKTRTIEIAAIEKKQASDVATENKVRAIAEAAAKKAAMEADLAAAEALREKQTQSVETVKVEAAAEREKSKNIIQAQGAAEQKYLADSRAADARAYQMQKDAEARKLAADADAEAVTKKAIAEANAAKARADGERALQLVPIEIDRERVKIDQSRVENVVKPELEAREKSGKVAQDFEIAKLQVQAEKEVRIESAKAMATIGAKMTMSLYGSPDAASSMLQSLMHGQQLAKGFNAFVDNVDSDGAIAHLKGVVEAVTGVVPKAEEKKV